MLNGQNPQVHNPNRIFLGYDLWKWCHVISLAWCGDMNSLWSLSVKEKYQSCFSVLLEPLLVEFLGLYRELSQKSIYFHCICPIVQHTIIRTHIIFVITKSKWSHKFLGIIKIWYQIFIIRHITFCKISKFIEGSLLRCRGCTN